MTLNEIRKEVASRLGVPTWQVHVEGKVGDSDTAADCYQIVINTSAVDVFWIEK